jgi:nudix-type nucleoside diphosphatase (YffH/AdpP family)
VETERETYDRGDGACLFLYDVDARTILLVRQFRYPAYVNDHPDGMLLELPAGLLDEDDARTAIRREVEEEVGLKLSEVRSEFSAYMSPGSVTERLHFFTGLYRSGDVRAGAIAGVAEEAEQTEVVEMSFDEALGSIGSEIVDAKTILMIQWAALSGPFAGSPR